MSTQIINGFTTTEIPGKFKVATRNPEKLNENDIYIEIQAAGVCHTDCLFFGMKDKVLGHESVGRVVATGSNVTDFKKGDRVGWSYLKSSCMHCDYCVSGQDIYCPERVMFPGDDNNNGFADGVVVDARFAYHIPSEIEFKYAASLMCAGATVFNALYSYQVSPTQSIGVVGIGGLGHLALQFANKWGCNVTAISGNPSKKEEAISFGAHHFLDSKEFGKEGFFEKVEKFDMILNTTSADLHYDDYLKLLKPKGKFLVIGVPSKPIEIKNLFGVIQNSWSLAGNLVGGRDTLREMLKFAARHQIKPKIEEYPFTIEGLEEAFDRCERSKVRYRAVLVKK
ncbi:chaperonin 10-like protein [Halteromyces radiatus]|uniref:chaperonin 10-like protein n=1 Tax=Halteromyces radiatus TaxID=101107 RepID=UPI00221FD2E3|nr:chaperonin 10-like protein [Halteromyces radiatus]KAI8081612.1 chaperonin 10-like protein [Halteromyces radiatus]